MLQQFNFIIYTLLSILRPLHLNATEPVRGQPHPLLSFANIRYVVRLVVCLLVTHQPSIGYHSNTFY